MEDESSYEYSDDEVSLQSEENLEDEVDFHMEIKKDAYDRYMEMLLKKAFEKVADEDDCQTNDDDDDDDHEEDDDEA